MFVALALFTVSFGENTWNLLLCPVWLHHDGYIEVRFPEPVDLVATAVDTTGASTVTIKQTHSVSLPAASEIHYSAVGTEKYAASLVFDKSDKLSFIVYGDSRHFEKRHESVFNAIVKEKPDFVIHLGDMVDNGLFSDQWRVFFRVTSSYWAEHVVYTVRGNHESPFNIYDQLLYPPYYSFKRGNITFIVLDTNQSLEQSSPQRSWFLNELEKARQDGRPIFVFMHHPIFTKGPHRKDEVVKRLQNLVPLLEEFGVKAVFSAHDHNYQHFWKNGVHYVITGGGGAGLYGVNENAHTDAELLNYAVKHHYVLVKISKSGICVLVKTPLGEVLDEFHL